MVNGMAIPYCAKESGNSNLVLRSNTFIAPKNQGTAYIEIALIRE
jgi:hypothetical protein